MMKIITTGPTEISITPTMIEIQPSDTILRIKKKPPVAPILQIEEPEQEAKQEAKQEQKYMDDRYTKHECAEMNDYQLAKHWIRITGATELFCRHCKGARNCKGSRPIMPYWMKAIRKRCLKVGLHKDIKVPKTCDEQTTRNDSCNPINNPSYSKLRSKKEDSKSVIEQRKEDLESIGIKARPYRYV